MHPILFSIGGFDIHVWGLMVSLGAAAGYMTALRFAEGSRFTESILGGYFFYAIPVGLAGARLWEVLFSWQNYAADPLQALMLWQGGMSIQGAVAADLLLAWGYIRKQKLSLAAFGDILAPGLILGQAIGRIGCFFNGDAYGQPTDAWYGIVYQPGTPAFAAWGSTPLVPAELFESAADFVILGILCVIFRRKRFDGQVVLWYFILYSAARFFLEFLRTDSLMAGPLKAAQLTTAVTAGAAVLVLVWLSKRRTHAGRGGETVL
jgi:phosphatidylglycerol:prolipoprotein diacylglycerol transferase